MRNWHHKIIKLDSALNILGTNYLPTVVAVSEEIVQFEILQANGNWIDPPNYKAVHPSFDDINGIRKIILRNYFVDSTNIDHNSSSQTKSSLFKYDSNNFSFHAIAVTGIISGNDLGNNTKGISPKSSVISTQNVFNAPLIALINNLSSNNLLGKYKDFYILADSEVKIPVDYQEFFLPYDSWAASVINQSQFFTIPEIGDFLNYSHSFYFVLQELFAYGRNGRGVLYVCASGNGRPEGDNPIPQAIEINDANFVQASSSKSLVVGASYIDLNENNYSALSNGYMNESVIIPEFVAQYSNYGNRLDIVAPSSPNGNLRPDEVGIYTPSPIKGGDFGVTDEELLIKRIISISSNKKVITLNNVYGIFKGQSVEIGDPTTFLHEFKSIKSVNYSTNQISFSDKLKFTQDLYNNVNLSITIVEVKITVLKLPLGTNISPNKFNIDSRLGIMKSLNDSNRYQKVFVCNKDEAEDRIDTNISNPSSQVRLITEVRSIEKSPLGNYIIEFVNPIPNLVNLYIIPDQMEIEVETFKSGGSVYFGCKTDYFLDGFFIGQKIKINDFMTNITFINYEARSFEAKHFNVQEGSSFTIYSLAYGSFLNSFGGTSAAAPIVSGVSSLVISANNFLNAAEIKHILKTTADQIGNVNYNDAPSDSTKYNYGYTVHEKYGTGRVNAQAAVQLALDWHDPTKYGSTVFKPRLEIADKLVGNTITNVTITEPVDSPDIWVSELANSNTIIVAPFNQINTSKKQYINIKVRNTGNRNSFKECDLRVFIAFEDTIANTPPPAFPFPSKWYDQTDVKLLAVKEIPIIGPNSDVVIQVEWKDIATKWNTWNPITSSGRRKKTYILAHIAPFDGLSTDVQTDNIRNNKQLTCKEIIVTHNGVSDGTAYLPGNNLNLTIGTEVVTKSFDFTMENILTTGLTGFKIKVTKMNNDTGHTVEEVFYKKTGTDWAFETAPSSNWIAFDSPTEIVGNHPDYTNLKFPHTIRVNENQINVKLEVVPTV
jgi:subtilisin family serine protease